MSSRTIELKGAAGPTSEPRTVDRMLAYQRATGLRPVGAHRTTADRLLRDLSHRCVNCGGEQFFPLGKAGWIWCAVCGGLGRVMTPKAQLLLRRRLIERFPAAALNGGELMAIQSANCSNIVTHSASVAVSSIPFNARNNSATTRVVRLLLSRNVWLREMPKA